MEKDKKLRYLQKMHLHYNLDCGFDSFSQQNKHLVILIYFHSADCTLLGSFLLRLCYVIFQDMIRFFTFNFSSLILHSQRKKLANLVLCIRLKLNLISTQDYVSSLLFPWDFHKTTYTFPWLICLSLDKQYFLMIPINDS